MLSWNSSKVLKCSEEERLSQGIWHNTVESTSTILPPSANYSLPEVSEGHEDVLTEAQKIYERLIGVSSHYRSDRGGIPCLAN